MLRADARRFRNPDDATSLLAWLALTATLKHLQTGAEVPLAARHLAGRSRTCQLQVHLANASAFHAELTWDGRAWHLRDLGSRNGTFVAGQRIPPGQQVTLEPGAEIGFGAPEGHYHCPRPASARR